MQPVSGGDQLAHRGVDVGVQRKPLLDVTNHHFRRFCPSFECIAVGIVDSGLISRLRWLWEPARKSASPGAT